MSRRERGKFRMYDLETPDFHTLNSFDSEIIEISSPPIKIFSFNVMKTMDKNQSDSPMDDLYPEVDYINEKSMMAKYEAGLSGSIADDIREGEMFDRYIFLEGYYQEPQWTQELQRIGIMDVEEDLSIVFNYQNMISKLGKPIKIGDMVQTFRGDVYRVQDAYKADEIMGWEYLHFHVIAKKPAGIDRFVLPGAAPIPDKPRGG